MKIVKLWLWIYIITSIIIIIAFGIANKYRIELLYEMLKGNILGALFWSVILRNTILK